MMRAMTRMAVAATAVAFALGMAASAADEPVLVTGNYYKGWVKLMQQKGVGVKVLTWTEGAFPAGELAGRKLLVMAYPRPKQPLSVEDNQKIQKWLEAGGMLIISSGGPYFLSSAKSDLSSLTWLGAQRYGFGKATVSLLAKDHPLVKGFGEDVFASPAFQGKFPQLAKPTTGVALVGNEKTAAVLLNRVGKGFALYVASSPVLLKPKSPEAAAYGQLVDVYLKAALGTDKDREPLRVAPAKKPAAVKEAAPRPFASAAGAARPSL